MLNKKYEQVNPRCIREGAVVVLCVSVCVSMSVTMLAAIPN